MAQTPFFTRFTLMNRSFISRWFRPGEGLTKRKKKQLFGQTDHDEAEVCLFKGGDNEKLEHTWWHELFHAALTAIGRQDLDEDEYFIDAISGAFHQIWKTGKGELRREPAVGESNMEDRQV